MRRTAPILSTAALGVVAGTSAAASVTLAGEGEHQWVFVDRWGTPYRSPTRR